MFCKMEAVFVHVITIESESFNFDTHYILKAGFRYNYAFEIYC